MRETEGGCVSVGERDALRDVDTDPVVLGTRDVLAEPLADAVELGSRVDEMDADRDGDEPTGSETVLEPDIDGVAVHDAAFDRVVERGALRDEDSKREHVADGEPEIV